MTQLPNLPQNAPRGEADPKEIAESAERYDNHYVDSPVRRATLAGS